LGGPSPEKPAVVAGVAQDALTNTHLKQAAAMWMQSREKWEHPVTQALEGACEAALRNVSQTIQAEVERLVAAEAEVFKSASADVDELKEMIEALPKPDERNEQAVPKELIAKEFVRVAESALPVVVAQATTSKKLTDKLAETLTTGPVRRAIVELAVPKAQLKEAVMSAVENVTTGLLKHLEEVVVLEFKRQVLPAVERASQAPQQGPNRPATQDVLRELDGLRHEVAELQELVANLARGQRQQTEALRSLAEMKRQARSAPPANFKREVDALIAQGDIDAALRLASQLNAQTPTPDAIGYVLETVVPDVTRIDQFFQGLQSQGKSISEETKLIAAFRCSTQLNAIETERIYNKIVFMRELLVSITTMGPSVDIRPVAQMASVLDGLNSNAGFNAKLQTLDPTRQSEVKSYIKFSLQMLRMWQTFNNSQRGPVGAPPPFAR
jgi:hypothetical protein